MALKPHQRVAHQADADDHHVLEQDVRGVLALGQTGFEGRKAQVHDEHQHGGDHDPQVVSEPGTVGVVSTANLRLELVQHGFGTLGWVRGHVVARIVVTLAVEGVRGVLGFEFWPLVVASWLTSGNVGFVLDDMSDFVFSQLDVKRLHEFEQLARFCVF